VSLELSILLSPLPKYLGITDMYHLPPRGL
jgi:hypothetical protein